jgi:[ribosomal protein S5]-alanine N-acetyltransferase
MVSTYSSARLHLRPMRYRDAWCLRSAFNTPGFDRGMYMMGPFSFLGAIKVIHGFMRGERLGYMYPFTIADKSNRCMGQIWIVRRRQWEIGYWMHPEFQRKGFMKEALQEIMRFAASQQIVPIVQTYLWNEPSQRVVLASGFQEVARDDEKITFAIVSKS